MATQATSAPLGRLIKSGPTERPSASAHRVDTFSPGGTRALGGVPPRSRLAIDVLMSLQRNAGNRATVRFLARQAAANRRESSQLSAAAEHLISPQPDPDEQGNRSGMGPSGMLDRVHGGGEPLRPRTKTSMERFFQVDFAPVRVHTGADADLASRAVAADAFTTGRDIFFRRGAYQPGSNRGDRLLAHELTHVVQQAGDNTLGVQRHASWEHRMLGDVKPEVLRTIVMGRDQARQRASAPKAKGGYPQKKRSDKALLDLDEDYEGVALLTPSGDEIDQADHCLEQEIQRLRDLRAKVPMAPNEAVARTMAATSETVFGVTLVPMKLRGGEWTLVSYGELTTLVDYYGGPEEIEHTEPDNFRSIILGLRERELRGFVQILGEVRGQSAEAAKKASYSDDLEFAGAIGDTGRQAPLKYREFMSDADYAELTLMGKLGNTAKAELPGQPETSYSSGLARNACHFAPYSWHAWADYHKKAEAIAGQAFTKRYQANLNPFTPANDKDRLRAEAAELERQALVQNGFGDHFLQDSYASGHLINKTLIMTWFAKWLDRHPMKQDFASKEDWRRVQATVYGQDPSTAFGTVLYDAPVGATASTDPQTAENATGSWADRFKALGLAIPASVRNPKSDSAELLRDWQNFAAHKGVSTLSGKDLLRVSKWVDMDGLSPVVGSLIADGVVVRASSYHKVKDTDLSGDTSQIGKARERFQTYKPGDTFTLRKEYVPTIASSGQQSPDGNQKKLAAVSHGDFLKFINHSYLQFSTNVLHNEFCANGLDVMSGDGHAIFKVYGDNAMLNQAADEGVAYSGETSQRSFRAIKALATQPPMNLDPSLSLTAIAARFPKSVLFDGTALSLADWHKEGGVLHGYCEGKLFPGIASTWNAKSTVVGSGGTVGGVVSKDVGAHTGDMF